jgi:tetratricopeptide (TPR) repeat protein
MSGFATTEREFLVELGLINAETDLAAMATEARVAAAEAKAAEAWEASNPRKGVELALAALGESLYCAPAYTMLSLFAARDLVERVRFLKLALQAGEAVLGERLAAETGSLGASPRGLAYLEARQHLASALAVSGEREAAFDHWREVMRLDPADPSRARFDFADALIDADANDEALALLDRFAADTDARVAYARALLAFRKGGAGGAADASLAAALTANGYVPAYLVGDRKPPKAAPLSVEPGSRDEAVIVAVNSSRAWNATPGAVAWLKEQRRRTVM